MIGLLLFGATLFVSGGFIWSCSSTAKEMGEDQIGRELLWIGTAICGSGIGLMLAVLLAWPE